MYEVLVERRAERDLGKLPRSVVDRVAPVLRELAENPRPVGCRKLVGATRAYRVRVGDYRIVYEIDDASRLVRVMFIRHRREAYR